MNKNSNFEAQAGSRWSPQSILDALDWEHTRGEVAQENRARVAITGLRGAGKSTLLNRLEGWDVSPVGSSAAGGEPLAGYEDLGMFVLIDLPEDEPESSLAGLSGDGLSLAALGEADLIVFLVDGALLAEFDDDVAAAVAKAKQMAEYRWLCRLRSLGRPLIPVLSKSDLLGERLVTVKGDLERRLATSLVAVSAMEDPDVGLRLLPRLLDAEPDLLVPLAGEIPALRQQAANRLIRQTALLSGVTGLEPVPLLDLPLQLALQARMLLRLAAIYGQARPGGSSREMVAAVAGSLGLRYAVQQVVKLLPVLGWVVSGILSGLSTYLIGRAAAAHYQGAWTDQMRRLRQARLPVATIDALTQGTAEVRNTARALPKQLSAHLPKRHRPGTELAPPDSSAGDVLAELGYATMEEAS